MEAFLTSNDISDFAKSGIIGLGIGAIFGFVAAYSRFCLRSACIEIWQFRPGQRTVVWLLAFAAALAGSQYLFVTDDLSAQELTQLSNPASLSGAVFGGVIFGIGMTLARGCVSRMVILGATGNVRAIVTGMIFAAVATASFTGLLAPLRQWIWELWVIPPSSLHLALFGPNGMGLGIGLAVLVLAVLFAVKIRAPILTSLAALVAGGAIAYAWHINAGLSRFAFDPMPINSISFTRPSIDMLTMGLTQTGIEPGFTIALVPGVFLGAVVAALLQREFKVKVFDTESGTLRYIFGAVLMGLGGVLAGGCSVGAGVALTSILSLTGFAALVSMIVGSGIVVLLEGRVEWAKRAG